MLPDVHPIVNSVEQCGRCRQASSTLTVWNSLTEQAAGAGICAELPLMLLTSSLWQVIFPGIMARRGGTVLKVVIGGERRLLLLSFKTALNLSLLITVCPPFSPVSAVNSQQFPSPLCPFLPVKALG